jgi:hypothetical protein
MKSFHRHGTMRAPFPLTDRPISAAFKADGGHPALRPVPVTHACLRVSGWRA